MSVSFASFSCIGLRASNQDRVLPPLAANERTLAAIADGIGGGPGGDIAAETALTSLQDSAELALPLPALFEAAAEAIAAKAEAEPALAGMGTTLSLVAIEHGELSIGHVGDTRIHLIRGGEITLLSEDQTVAAELVRRGVLDAAEAEQDPRRNMLLSALSAGGRYSLQTASVPSAPGDRILLTTDGLHTKVGKAAMLLLSASFPRSGDFAAALRMMAEAAAPDDNYSAVVVDLL